MPTLRPVVFVAALVLFSPIISAADTLLFRATNAGELVLTFGLEPFELSEFLESDEEFFVSGSVTLVSGPLLNLVVDPVNGTTDYSYGAGLLQLSLTAFDGVNQVTGTFSAPTNPFGFVVCEGCDSMSGGGNADDFEIQLGPGQFDAALAAALHVQQQTLGGSIDFGLEDITGDPSSSVRLAADHRGFANLEIDAVDVPEPAALLLMLTGGSAWLVRRRRTLRAQAATTSVRPGTSPARTSVPR